MVELERIDAGGPSHAQRTIVESTRPRRSPLRTVAGVAVAVVVTGVLVGLVTAGGGAESSAPTTTQEPTTTLPDETSTSSVPTTAPTTTVPAPTTTAIPFVNGRQEPVLGVETGGWLLYVVSSRTIARVELDTGRVTTAQLLSGSSQDGANVFVNGDRLIVQSPSGNYAVPFDLREASRLLTNAQPLRSASANLWTVLYGNNGTASRLLIYGRNGEIIADRALPPGADVRGVSGNRLVLATVGRIYTMDTAGAIVPYAIGAVAAVNDAWILWVECDDKAACHYVLGTATNPRARTVGLTAVNTTFFENVGALSPDGRMLTIYGRDSSGEGFWRYDVDTGRRLDERPSLYYLPAWTPDSAWIFRQQGQRLEAISTATGDTIQLNIPGITLSGNGLAGMVVTSAR